MQAILFYSILRALFAFQYIIAFFLIRQVKQMQVYMPRDLEKDMRGAI